MASPPTVMSYEAYKQDTNYVANWLAQTARQSGIKFSLINKLARGGRARSILPAYIFAQLARRILNRSVPVEVPASLLSAAKSAIAARQAQYDHHVSIASSGPQHTTNQTHLYFITALKQTLNALAQCKAKFDAAKNSSKPSPSSVPTKLPPVYAKPAIEDDSDEDSSNDAEQALSDAESEELAELIMEKFVALQRLLADVNDLRNKVKNAWEQYARSEVDLISAAVMVNTSISLAQRLEDNFEQDYPETISHGLLFDIFDQLCTAQGFDKAHDEYLEDRVAIDCYPILEATLAMPHSLLSFLGESPMGTLFTFREDEMSQLDSQDAWATKSGDQRLMHDRALLYKMTPCFCALANISNTRIGKFPILDLFTRGTKALHCGGKPSLWLAFATQCYLEAHHSLGVNIHCGHSDLHAVSIRIRDTAVQTLKYHAYTRWYKDPFAFERDMYKKMIASVNFYILGDICNTACRVYNIPDLDKVAPPFFILKNHPLLCGLLALKLCKMANEASLLHVNLWRSLSYPIQLYNAVRQESTSHGQWPQMEALMATYSDKDLFYGTRPTRPYEYQLRCSQMLGWSSSNAARDSKSYNWHSETHLQHTIPISTLVAQWINDESTPDILDSHLSRLEALLNARSVGTSTKAQSSSRLTHCELISLLSTELQSEMPRLKHDLLALHRQAFELLRRIRIVLNKTFIEYLGPNYLPSGETQLSMIVAHILLIACDQPPKISPVRFIKLPSTWLRENILEIVGRTVDQYLQGLESEESRHGRAGRYDDMEKQVTVTNIAVIEELRGFRAEMAAAKAEADLKKMVLADGTNGS